jgi:hypothetical protein
MHVRSLLVGLAALMITDAPAQADPSMAAGERYVGVEGGLTVWNPIDPNLAGVGDSGYRPGAGAVLRAGWQWRDHVRFDAQLGWEGTRLVDVADRIDVVHATAQAYWDFAEPGAWVRPYLGFGLGVAGGWLQNDPSLAPGVVATRSGVGLAYVIAGGGRFRLADPWSLACAYRFLGTARLIADGSGGSVDPTLHAFMVGFHRAF